MVNEFGRSDPHYRSVGPTPITPITTNRVRPSLCFASGREGHQPVESVVVFQQQLATRQPGLQGEETPVIHVIVDQQLLVDLSLFKQRVAHRTALRAPAHRH